MKQHLERKSKPNLEMITGWNRDENQQPNSRRELQKKVEVVVTKINGEWEASIEESKTDEKSKPEVPKLWGAPAGRELFYKTYLF
jgi:hypothetical protein